jgi:uncharacterized YccA/Bax inhibitor family protein
MAFTNNPALNDRVLGRETGGDTQVGWAAPETASGAAPGGPGLAGALPLTTDGKVMTLGGTFTATLVLFILLLAGGWYGWGLASSTKHVETATGAVSYTYSISPAAWIALLVGTGLAFLTIFKPKAAPFTGPLYAVAEGVALGAISALFDAQFNGIVLQAVMATMSVFAVMLFLYATRIVKVTEGFRRAILGAMVGILILYVGTLLASLFGANLAFWDQPTPLGIGISLFIAGVAAFRLMLDFDFIEHAVEARAPRYFEWYGAFGLTMGLVWLYLEILRLISLLRQR